MSDRPSELGLNAKKKFGLTCYLSFPSHVFVWPGEGGDAPCNTLQQNELNAGVCKEQVKTTTVKYSIKTSQLQSTRVKQVKTNNRTQ